VGKSEIKRPLGRPRRRREDNIKMDFKIQVGMVRTKFIWLRIGPVEGFCDHGNEPSGSVKCSKIV
jgi:hypothetical protein